MNKAFLTIGIILMIILGIFAINMITSQQTGQELDYYLLKNTSEAALTDSLDNIYYEDYGVVRMDKEKFIDSFIRRFAAGVDASRGYDFEFYDLNEVPPKVSVRVSSKSNSISKDKTNIVVKINLINEAQYTKDTWTTNFTYKDYNITSSKNIKREDWKEGKYE